MIPERVESDRPLLAAGELAATVAALGAGPYASNVMAHETCSCGASILLVRAYAQHTQLDDWRKNHRHEVSILKNLNP